MPENKPNVHPYIPNSVPDTQEQMLNFVGAESIDEFYEEIPENLRLRQDMNLPPPLSSEFALKQHVTGLLAKNTPAGEYTSFLGAGCYQHHVPAVCDEINQRSEFLTAYAGEPYDDHGRFQTLFEYTSMMGELLNMDVVNVPTYDGYQSAATAVRMAARLTGRSQVLIAGAINPGKLSRIRDYCQHDIEIKLVDHHPETGGIDINKLINQISSETAGVYFENPNFLGVIETSPEEITALAHEYGAESVVGVDPISLGILAPPADYGADIVCGDIQPLGIHMQYGGGHAGFIATRDEERYVMEFPSRLFGIAPTIVEGEYGFGDVAYERTSFAIREKGKEWVGTAAALWGITAGVYLALMGPCGMQEIGEGIMTRTRYAMMELDQLEGVCIPFFNSHHFQEFLVNFDGTGKTVAEINQALLQNEIFGGVDLSLEYPELGQSALFCISEVHNQSSIDRLVSTLKEVFEK
jgi:glycine dehydrogenase subunit 1